MAPFGLRLEWVSVERGHVIVDIQRMQPLQIMKHETRPEPDGAPIFQVMVNSGRAAIELAAGREKPAIMSEIVDSYLEAVPR